MNTSHLYIFSMLACMAAFIAASPPANAQQEIGYIEEFALAADREQALKQLIPGTEDFYYYHSLHYQNTGQRAKCEDTLSQ